MEIGAGREGFLLLAGATEAEMLNGPFLKADVRIRVFFAKVAALCVVMTSLCVAPSGVAAQNAKVYGDLSAPSERLTSRGPLEMTSNGTCLGRQVKKISSRFHATAELKCCVARNNQHVLHLTIATRFGCHPPYGDGSNVLLALELNTSFLVGKSHTRIVVTAGNAFIGKVVIVNDALRVCDRQALHGDIQKIYLRASNSLRESDDCLRFWKWVRGGCRGPTKLELDVRFFKTGVNGDLTPIPHGKVVRHNSECWTLLFFVEHKTKDSNLLGSTAKHIKVTDLCSFPKTVPLPTTVDRSVVLESQHVSSNESYRAENLTRSEVAARKTRTEQDGEASRNCLEEKELDISSMSSLPVIKFHATNLSCNSTKLCQSEEGSIFYKFSKECRGMIGGLSCKKIEMCRDAEGRLSHNSTKLHRNRNWIRTDGSGKICRNTHGGLTCKLNNLCRNAVGGLFSSCKARQCKDVHEGLSCNSTLHCRMPLVLTPRWRCGSAFSSKNAKKEILLRLGDSFRKTNLSFQVIVTEDEKGDAVLMEELVTICNVSTRASFLRLQPVSTETSRLTDFWQWLYVRCKKQHYERHSQRKVYINFKLSASGSEITPEQVWQDKQKQPSTVVMTVHSNL